MADFRDTVQHKTASGRIDQVDHIVHGAAKLVDVFAVERRDERLIEFPENLVRNLVAVMLDGLDALHLFGHARVVFEHLYERVRSHDNVFRLLLKQNEESPSWHESLQKSRHGTLLPPEERSVALGSLSGACKGRQGSASPWLCSCDSRLMGLSKKVLTVPIRKY